jgi:hypothetical protein
MKVNLSVDVTPESIAEMTDQLPADEFGRMKDLIEAKSLVRFKGAIQRARSEFRGRGLRRTEFETALVAVRGKKR